MKLNLVDNWRMVWHWASAWGITALAALPAAYEMLATVREYLSPSQLHRAVIILAALTLVARITKQKKGEPNEPTDTDKAHS